MQYDVIILGATCAALGLAHALKGRRVAVVDATSLVAGEFVYAFRAGCPQNPGPSSAPARKLYDGLQKPGEQGAFFGAGAHFFRAFLELGEQVLLETTVTRIERKRDGYRLNAFGCAGAQVYDTRVLIDTSCDPERITDKALGFVLVGAGGPPPALPEGCAQFYPVQASPVQTAVLRCPVQPDDDLFSARHKLLDMLREQRAALGMWRIGAIAPCFDYRCLPGIRAVSDGWYRLASCAFSDPFAAVDGGHAFGKEALA